MPDATARPVTQPATTDTLAPPPRELRILSGVHAGASVPAHAGLRLGSALAADVVLADPGLPDTLVVLCLEPVLGWQWLALPDTPDTADDIPAVVPDPRGWLAPNQPARLGPIWITVAAPDGPWPTVPAETEATDPTITLAAVAHNDPAVMAVPPTPTSDAERAPLRPARHGLTALLVLVCLAVLLAIGLLLFAPGPTTTPAPAAVSAPVSDQAAQLAAIRQTIDTLGLSQSVRVETLPDGSLQVQGWVASDAELERLASALARLWPMPGLRVTRADALQAQAESLLRGLAGFFVVSQPVPGQLAVSGIAPDAEQQAHALDLLAQRLPGLTIDASGLHTSAALHASLTEALAQVGLPPMDVTWQRPRWVIDDTHLDDAQFDALPDVVTRLNTRWGGPVLGLASEGAGPTNRVPFGIRSVVGGVQPYVVLDDGRKLLPGGVYRRYRLEAIEPNQLVFDGPRRAVVPR